MEHKDFVFQNQFKKYMPNIQKKLRKNTFWHIGESTVCHGGHLSFLIGTKKKTKKKHSL